MMAIILLGHLLFFALFHNSMLHLLRMELPCVFALKILRKAHGFFFPSGKHPPLACNEHFMMIVSSLENVWRPKK